MNKHPYKNFRKGGAKPKPVEASILHYTVRIENGKWVSEYILRPPRPPLFINKPFCPKGDLPYLERLMEKNINENLYVMAMNQMFKQTTQTKKTPFYQEHSSIISETGWKDENPHTTMLRGIKEEFGLKLKPDMTLTKWNQDKWELNEQKTVTSFYLTPKDLEPYTEAEYLEHKEKNQAQGSDDKNYKSILYLIGTQTQFQDMLKTTRFSFAPKEENITGYMLVPLAQMIKMIKKIDYFVSEKFLPIRALWNQYQENPDTKEVFKEKYLKYLQGLQLGNHQKKIESIKREEFKQPECPSIISWNLDSIWGRVKKK